MSWHCIPALIGGWSDRSSSHIGSRLPFIIVGAALTMAALVLMPIGDGSLVWVSLCLVTFFIAYFVYYAPYYALYPDIVPTGLRGRSQGIQGALRSAGLLLAMGAGGLLLAVWQPLPFVIAAVVVFAVTAGLLAQVNGYPSQAPPRGRPNTRLAGTLDLLRHSRAIRRWACANACWEAAIGSLRTFVVLYFTVGLGLSLQETSAALTFVGVGALIAAPVAGRLADHYGVRPVMEVAIWVFAVGLMPPLFTTGTTYAAAIVPVAFAAVVLMTLPYTMLMGLLPSGGAHGAGAGLWGLSRGVGVLAGPLLAGLATELTASIDALSFAATQGYASIFGVSAVLLLASLPFLRGVDEGTMRQTTRSTSLGHDSTSSDASPPAPGDS